MEEEQQRALRLCGEASALEFGTAGFEASAMDRCGEMYLEAAQLAPNQAAVQAAMAAFFVRRHIESLQANEGLAEVVAQAFEVALADEHGEIDEGSSPLGEYAVFLSRVEGELEQAHEVFLRALLSTPDDADLLYNFGNFMDQALDDQREASMAYEQALAADPSHSPTLNNFAALLIEKGRNAVESDQQRYFSQAKELLLRAESQAPGFPAYNLACLASLSGAVEDCERWLREAYSSESFSALPQADDLKDDEDLASAHTSSWFETLLQEIREAQAEAQPLRRSSEADPCDSAVDKMDDIVSVSFLDQELRFRVAGLSTGGGATTGAQIWNASFVLLRLIEGRALSGWCHHALLLVQYTTNMRRRI